MKRSPRAARVVAAAALSAALVAGLPGPALAAAAEYRLGFGDAVSVSVVGQPSVAVLGQPVRPDGRITLPLVQDVIVQGKTVQEVTAALNRAYRPYFNDSQVVVQVAKFRELRVTMIGQVQKPGAMAFATTPTLAEAIAGAGGLTERADRRSVKVVLPGGKQQVYDLDEVLNGGKPMPTVPEGAVVEVGEVWGPDVYRMLPLVSAFITAGVLLLR